MVGDGIMNRTGSLPSVGSIPTVTTKWPPTQIGKAASFKLK